MGAKCDRCGNFDEGYREEMEYQSTMHHCIQDYQPDMLLLLGFPAGGGLRLERCGTVRRLLM